MCESALQKRCKELLPIIQAGAEGKTLEYRQFASVWKPVSEKMTFGCDEFRIKPEPQYRPYTPREATHLLECGAWIRGGDGVSYDVVAVERHGVRLSNREVMSFEMLLERFRRLSGHPCGVLVD